jgi:hypothetical protein
MLRLRAAREHSDVVEGASSSRSFLGSVFIELDMPDDVTGGSEKSRGSWRLPFDGHSAVSA